ncbi:hypothetical protein KHQ06_25335 [Nocardia tengchongensis]|uniref:Uncharacterized protein n=1 Tax=Nocardia tengchongensis TaxID=2055889 RepID=A0ABX8CK28_9NOCA|nr:hypothetical protein [Nocardia tengchongensis]QVI19666.1 hypothetical protein KHQ06_25335 [Nocardia tengchongensis]
MTADDVPARMSGLRCPKDGRGQAYRPRDCWSWQVFGSPPGLDGDDAGRGPD